MPGYLNAYFHRNSRLASLRYRLWDPHPKSHHRDLLFLQTGRYMPQTEFLLTAALHAIERAIGGAQQLFNRRSVVGIDSETRANGHRRFLAIACKPLADSQRGLASFLFSRFRQD